MKVEGTGGSATISQTGSGMLCNVMQRDHKAKHIMCLGTDRLDTCQGPRICR